MRFGLPQVRHRRDRKARSVLLWLVTCFAASQIGLAAAESWYYPFFRDPEYGYRFVKLQRRVISSQGKPITVLMLGSSRTFNGFCGGPIEQELCQRTGQPIALFNFGIPAAGPVMQLMVLNRLLQNGIRPDGILLEVMPPYLAGPNSTWSVASLSLSRLWSCDLSILQALDPKHRDRTSRWRRQAYLWPWYSHRVALLRALAPWLLAEETADDLARHIDDCGWVELPSWSVSHEAREQWTAKAYSNFASYWDDYQPGGPSCDALGRILRRCRAEGIAVKLVIMPEGPIFQSWYPSPAWRAFEMFLQEVQRDYAVEVVNAREWIEEEGFFDSHHLLPPGAQRFSERLGREVLEGWIRKELISANR